MKTLSLIKLGELRIANPLPGEPAYLSAASGASWVNNTLYVVGDDQGTVVQYELKGAPVMSALRLGECSEFLQPGIAQPILPGGLPKDESARKEAKADFEALTIITRRQLESLSSNIRSKILRLFPHGLMVIAGSGGRSWGGTRRSIGVVYQLDLSGAVIGFPSRISLNGLHAYLEKRLDGGELNIEGITVHEKQVVLAQRGNSIDKQTKLPAKNILFHLSLEGFVQNLYTDLTVDACEVKKARSYNLGSRPLEHNGASYDAKLDFTDVDSVTGDPFRRMVFTAAAEGPDGTPIRGEIAGSVVGIIDEHGNITETFHVDDRTIKFEGVNATFNHTNGDIDLLLVPDADDPSVAAPLYAARIAA